MERSPESSAQGPIPAASAEGWALWQLGAHGPITAAALAARLKLDATHMGELFDGLGRRGLVRLNPQGLPALTARGRRALVTLIRARHEAVAR
jgi:hypothetical protein